MTHSQLKLSVGLAKSKKDVCKAPAFENAEEQSDKRGCPRNGNVLCVEIGPIQELFWVGLIFRYKDNAP